MAGKLWSGWCRRATVRSIQRNFAAQPHHVGIDEPFDRGNNAQFTLAIEKRGEDPLARIPAAAE